MHGRFPPSGCVSASSSVSSETQRPSRYNAQVAVEMDSLLIVKTNTVQAGNDKQQVEPMLKKLEVLPDELGQLTTLVADTGFYSEANINHWRTHRHPLDCRRLGRPPPRSDGTVHRTQTLGLRCHRGRNDAPSPQDERWPCPVCEAQMHGRTRDRHHQIGTGFPAILPARVTVRSKANGTWWRWPGT